jgi:oxaloacetate decarboxylase gamma subunit
MDQVLSNAFSILIVGMVTVFLMLWVVVLIGNLLIWGTNKFATEELPVQKKENPNLSSKGSIAALVAAVEVITKGKGRVSNITKL